MSEPTESEILNRLDKIGEFFDRPTEEQIYNAALSKFGHPSQINKMIEECSELITSLCHHRISRAADDEVCEELADVEIILGQMRIIFGADNVERMKQKKLDRLAERTGLKLALYGVCG